MTEQELKITTKKAQSILETIGSTDDLNNSDCQGEREQLIKAVEQLIKEKQDLFSQECIESPMSDEEKRLTRDIAKLWSKINSLTREIRKGK